MVYANGDNGASIGISSNGLPAKYGKYKLTKGQINVLDNVHAALREMRGLTCDLDFDAHTEIKERLDGFADLYITDTATVAGFNVKTDGAFLYFEGRLIPLNQEGFEGDESVSEAKITETKVSFTLYADFYIGHTLPIDDNGESTEMTTHDGFEDLESAIWALKKVKEANYSNIKYLYITKDTFTEVFDEDGDSIDDSFESKKVFDENSDY